MIFIPLSGVFGRFNIRLTCTRRLKSILCTYLFCAPIRQRVTASIYKRNHRCWSTKMITVVAWGSPMWIKGYCVFEVAENAVSLFIRKLLLYPLPLLFEEHYKVRKLKTVLQLFPIVFQISKFETWSKVSVPNGCPTQTWDTLVDPHFADLVQIIPNY